jgi:Transposase
MRIKTTNTKNGRLFYVIKTYYDTRRIEHSITVEKLGNENAIREKYGRDPDEWAKEYVKKFNKIEEQEMKDIAINFSKKHLLSKNHRYEFNIGYLFLQSLYNELGINKICREIAKKHDFEYNLDSILSRLIYGRILKPCSKLATHKFSETLLENPDFSEHQVYRSLDVIAEESAFIQQLLYKNSFVLGKRHTGVIYYDCTNFFFEIEQPDIDGLRKYGKSKESRPLPIVEMGLFMDQDGIPLAVCIHPGNTNEQITLKPLEQKLISDYQMSKFVVCTDAGLASKANRKFNDVQNRAFIVTQSIKQLNAELKEWSLNPSGWKISGDTSIKTYELSSVNLPDFSDKTFYKERWVDRGNYEEKLIVTYSNKYRDYQRNIRNSQIERAQKAIDSGDAKRGKHSQNDYRRFIQKTTITEDGELTKNTVITLDSAVIEAEERFDGFYAVCSNLDEEPSKIIAVNHQRWQIEECFRIMKSEFRARPAFVQNDHRIEAHFLTCFIALVVYRYLEKRLDHRFTCEQILETLRDMNVREVAGEGYIPTYMRTEITDTLHEAFGFRTDFQIISKPDMKKIIKKSKF